MSTFPENLSGFDLIGKLPVEFQALAVQILKNAWDIELLVTSDRHYVETVTRLDNQGLSEEEFLKRTRRANSLNEFPYTFANTVFTIREHVSGEELDRGKKEVADLWEELVYIAIGISPRSGEEFEEAIETIKSSISKPDSQ